MRLGWWRLWTSGRLLEWRVARGCQLLSDAGECALAAGQGTLAFGWGERREFGEAGAEAGLVADLFDLVGFGVDVDDQAVEALAVSVAGRVQKKKATPPRARIVTVTMFCLSSRSICIAIGASLLKLVGLTARRSTGRRSSLLSLSTVMISFG